MVFNYPAVYFFSNRILFNGSIYSIIFCPCDKAYIVVCEELEGFIIIVTYIKYLNSVSV